MQGVITRSLAGLGLAALMTLTAGGAVAVFVAGGPGENLSPVDGAELLIDLAQVNSSVLWSSSSGPIDLVETRGWPTSDGVHDLGGGLTIERPANPLAGAINIGEPPMSLTFTRS